MLEVFDDKISSGPPSVISTVPASWFSPFEDGKSTTPVVSISLNVSLLLKRMTLSRWNVKTL